MSFRSVMQAEHPDAHSRGMTELSFRIGGLLGGFGLFLVALIYFPIGQVVWLAFLMLLAGLSPSTAVAFLFVGVSADTEHPIGGRVVVSLSELLLAGVFFSALLVRPGGRNCWNSLDTRPLLWGAPLGIAVFLSGAIHNEWIRVLPHTLRMMEIVAAMFLCVNVLKRNRRKEAFAWAVTGAASLFSIHGLYQFQDAYQTRIFSFFGNPNQFAAYLVILIPFLAVFLWCARTRLETLANSAALTLAVSALLLTQSRGALSGLTAGLGVLLIQCSRKREVLPLRCPAGAVPFRKGIVAAVFPVVFLVVLVAASCFSPGFRNRLSESFSILQERQNPGVTRSFREIRLPFLDLGWQIFRDHPILGIGPGNYERTVRNQYQSVVEGYRNRLTRYALFRDAAHIHAHNLYLQTAAVLGLLGLTGLVFFLINVGAAFRSTAPLSIAGLGTFAAFLVHNLFDVTYPSLGIELGLVWGYALSGAWWPGKVYSGKTEQSGGRSAGSSRPIETSEKE